MYFSTHVLLALLAAAAAPAALADWTLLCGPSCGAATTAVASGGSTDARLGCHDLGATYAFCRLRADDPWNKALLTEAPDCRVSDGAIESPGLFAGDCTPAGTWNTYQVVLNL
ncbi:hypothetical protein F4780DRAFT_780545 [Xylariomycetidae sp. FL0641]|nr:hypothetical protein F4780DRAFT_780545 [Xylariomycetidae sp. FL0641]